MQDDAYTLLYACGRATVLIHVADVGLSQPVDVFPRPRAARPLLPPLRAADRHLSYIPRLCTIFLVDAAAVRDRNVWAVA